MYIPQQDVRKGVHHDVGFWCDFDALRELTMKRQASTKTKCRELRFTAGIVCVGVVRGQLKNEHEKRKVLVPVVFGLQRVNSFRSTANHHQRNYTTRTSSIRNNDQPREV